MNTINQLLQGFDNEMEKLGQTVLFGHPPMPAPKGSFNEWGDLEKVEYMMYLEDKFNRTPKVNKEGRVLAQKVKSKKEMYDLFMRFSRPNIEKVALTRYAITDYSDEAGADTAFLHRKAGGSTFDQIYYTPPSKQQYENSKSVRMKKKLGLYSEGRGRNATDDRLVSNDGLTQYVEDFQTQRAMTPEYPIMEFK